MSPCPATLPPSSFKPLHLLRHLITVSAAAAANITPLSQFPSPVRSQHHPHNEEPDPSTHPLYWTQKIHTLCSSPSPDPDAALLLLDRLRPLNYRPPPFALSSIIFSLCARRRFLEAHRRVLLFLSSPSSSFIPSNSLISHLLDSPQTPLLTLHLIRRLSLFSPSFRPPLPIFNRLIHRLSSCSLLTEAHRLLDDMLSSGPHPDAVSFTTLISGYARNGQLDLASQLFDKMRNSGFCPNSLTLSVVITALLKRRRLGEAKEVMARLWVAYNEPSSVRSAAYANLIDSLCRDGFFHEVFAIAEEMPQGEWVPPEFAYGQMIDSLCRAGKYHGASRIVYIMRRRGLVPSLVSYNSIVHGLSKEKGSMRAYQLFKEGIGFGYSLPEPTYKVLVEGLCKEMDLNKAKDVAEFMIGTTDLDKTRIFNIFLSALCLVDNPIEQLNVLVSMIQKQCWPDVVTLNTIIHGFCKIGKVTEASKILNDMLKGKFCAPDVVSFTTIIHGLLDVERPEEALDLLHKTMRECSCVPNVVTYNVVLSGLFKHGKADDAMDIFKEMNGEGVSTNSITYTVIMEGLFEVGRVEEAKRFWDDVVWASGVHDDYVYAAMLRGLCRSGKFDVACDFLYELVDCGVGPGIVNYNILVDAACKVGLKKEAYQIVGEMRRNSLKPDAVTWRILDKLHERESTTNAGGNRFSETESIVGDKSPMLTEMLIEGFNCKIENARDTLEGLVDPRLSPEVIEESEIDEEPIGTSKVDMDASVRGKDSIKVSQKEPLSRIARRVFGLL